MDRLTEIFNNHRELMAQFLAIERQTTLMGDLSFPVNLHTYSGQARVREEIGRVCEEVAEVLTAETTAERVEEVADVLSFLIELFTTVGVNADSLVDHCGDIQHDSLTCIYSETHVVLEQVPISLGDSNNHWHQFVVLLWKWAHMLKAKPWKLNPKPTDTEGFKSFSSKIFKMFIFCCYLESIEDDLLYRTYVRKSRRNRERIASGA